MTWARYPFQNPLFVNTIRMEHGETKPYWNTSQKCLSLVRAWAYIIWIWAKSKMSHSHINQMWHLFWISWMLFFGEGPPCLLLSMCYWSLHLLNREVMQKRSEKKIDKKTTNKDNISLFNFFKKCGIKLELAYVFHKKVKWLQHLPF